MRYLGAHLSATGGGVHAFNIANTLGMNAIQIMPSAPMRWSSKDIPSENASEFMKNGKDSSVKKVLMHGVYLINLARGDSAMFHLSKLSVLTYVNYSNQLRKYAKEYGTDIDIIGTTFHPGSAKDLTVEEGIVRISQGLNWIIDNSEGDEMILLESSAGSGNVMGDTLEELALMRDGVEKKERVGFVLDTQHMFVSGYDWVNDLEGVVKNIEDTIGLENVKCFHLNDSIPPLGSHKDRHANLGEGNIGEVGIKGIINHPKLIDIPFILETPNLKTDDLISKEYNTLKSWVL